MTAKKICFLLSCATALWPLPADGCPQEGAAVSGRVVQSERRDFEIPLAELGTRLIERVEYLRPPLPANWDQMKVPEREAWMKSFRESEPGKTLIAENEKIQKNAQVFDVNIDADGKFVVYDVPPGSYGLRGRVDKPLENRKFAFEVFGQVEVLKDVDELVLDPIMVLVTPLLAAGETAPEFQVKTHDNSAELVNDQFRGKYLFLNFWSTESPPSVEFQADVQKMFDTLKDKYTLELLSISLDKDRGKAIASIRSSKMKGRHGFTDGWNHPTLENFGVRAIPSHWLIGPDGIILMAHNDFRRAFFSGKPNLETIVEDRIQGKDIPTPAGAAADTDKSGE